MLGLSASGMALGACAVPAAPTEAPAPAATEAPVAAGPAWSTAPSVPKPDKLYFIYWPWGTTEDDLVAQFEADWGVTVEKMPEANVEPLYAKVNTMYAAGEQLDVIKTLKRYCRGWGKWANRLLDQGKPLSIWFRGFFGFPRDLMGLENLCMAYYLDSNLVQTIVQDRCQFIKRLFTPVLERFHINCVLIWEDMAYNHGSMISPDTFRRFMLPYYQEVNDFFHGKGVDRVLVDSDGNILELCSLFIEGHADGVYPLEIAAGSNPTTLRERYPDFVLMGGVDKRALAVGPEAIDRELERLMPVVERGGYLPLIDHLVPPDVSLENYLYYLKRRQELFC